jgi:hypothetical protein
VWKKDQKDKRLKQNLKLALIALCVLGLLLVFGRVFQFFSEFQKPFSALNSKHREYSWDGKSSINLIFAKVEDQNGSKDLKQMSFVSLNPASEEIRVLKLSGDIFLALPKNFGSWKLASIYKLGQENKPPMGEDLVKMSVSKMLGLPVDGIIEVSSKEDLDVEKEVMSWKGNLLSGFSFLTRIRTDLSLKESMEFVTKASKIRQDNIVSLDLFKSTITESKLLPDSSRVLGVDGVKLDTYIKQNLNDPLLLEEDLTVAIYNGTDHPGLTAAAARMVNNLGARVTIIGNTSEKSVKSGTFINTGEGEDVKSTATFKRLAEIFTPECLKTACTTSDQEVLSSRASINIVLGEDYYNYWFSR